MRDLNPEELKDYLAFCQTSDAQMPENWIHGADSTNIQEILDEHHFLDLEGELKVDLEQYSMKDALTAMWLTAFQCGREFETRHQESRELEGMLR